MRQSALIARIAAGLMSLSTFAAAPVWADWMKVEESDKGVRYLDPATIQKNGSFRRLWELQDLRARHPDGESSRRLLWEFDCEGNRFRGLSISTHRGPMATGETILSNSTAADWSDVPPGSAIEATLRFACFR
jgi:hypothetical protein